MANEPTPGDARFPLLHILQPGEVVDSQAIAQDVVIAVTDHRLIVADERRTILDLPFADVRRVQFDIEQGRAATLVIVPEHVTDEPQVLSVPIQRLRETALALALVGERLPHPHLRKPTESEDAG